MQKIKEYFNKLQIISYIVATILGILYMIFKIDKLLDIALVSLLFTLYGHAYFGKKWAIYGRTWNRKNDKDFKNNEYRKYSDTIFNILYIVLITTKSSYKQRFQQPFLTHCGKLVENLWKTYI